MTDGFGNLILLIGDLHISDRKPSIPKLLDELLNTDKIDYVLCTGNIGNAESLKKLQSLAPNVHIVCGDMDPINLKELCDFPKYKIIDICGFKIGLVHGHQFMPQNSNEALASWQRKFDCDILVSGGTHRSSAERIEGKVYIDPGSATGAYAPGISNSYKVVPSFMLMSVNDAHVTLYIYELIDGKVHVAMSQFPRSETE